LTRDHLPAFPLLGEYVAHYSATQPDALALVSDEVTMTYASLRTTVLRWSDALTVFGVQKGERIAILGNSRPECFIAFLACAEIGAVYLGLNPKYSLRELSYVIRDSSPRLIFGMHSASETELDQRLEAIARDPVLTAPLVTREHVIANVSQPLNDFLEVHRGGAGGFRDEVKPEEPVALVYTSGSTGEPKGALLSQRGMIRSACITWETWYGRVEPLRTIAQHPINHVGWLICECVSALVAGGILYFRERFSGADTLRAIERYRLNLWVAFPSMIILAIDSDDFRSADLSSLERVALGTMTSVELMRQFRERSHATFSVSYGLTEASGGALTYTPDDATPEQVATTMGVPVPGVELRVLNAEGRDTAPGEPGELLVRDPSLFVGYLNRPDATAQTIDAEGWLHTGDAVALNEDGSYRMVGRLKEMFKSGGYNVYPTEVEAVLSANPSVSAACVVPAEDELWGEVGVAFVILKPGARETEPELRGYARERLANYKIPKTFVFRDDLPRLPNGKFDKVGLRREAATLHPRIRSGGLSQTP
jgi:acyl-CoA synthetase (AMP-forming)/AMP-acid ligase II